MQAIRCELCGSQDIVKEDGLFVCRNCKTKYSPEEARKLVGTVKIDNSETVDNLFILARRAFQTKNFADAEKYYSMVLPEAPNNVEACFFREISRAMAIGVSDAYGRFTDAYLGGIRTVFALYKKNGYDANEKTKIDVLVDFILGHIRELETQVKKSSPASGLEPINAMNNLTRIYWDLEKELRSNLPNEPELAGKVKKAYANFLRRKTVRIPEEP